MKQQTGKPQAATKRRWPYFGKPQRTMVLAGFAMWLGVALPWFVLREFNVTRYASPLAASWVLWAGLMAMAGAVSRWRFLAILSAFAGGATGLFISVWQALVIFRGCGGFDIRLRCFPGPGVFLVIAMSAVVLLQAYRTYTRTRAAAPAR